MQAPPDPLASLEDINLPETPVSYWPPPVHFWFVLILVIGIQALVIWWQRRKKSPLLKMAKQLEQASDEMVSQFHKHKNNRRLLADILSLIKQVAIIRHGRSKVAGLHGEDWLAFLKQCYDIKSIGDDEADLLCGALYDPKHEVDSKSIFTLKNHLLHIMLTDLAITAKSNTPRSGK